MKTALITGGSRGIGRACVLAFAQAGWQVAWCYRKEKEQSLALEQELKSRGLSGLVSKPMWPTPDKWKPCFPTRSRFWGRWMPWYATPEWPIRVC